MNDCRPASQKSRARLVGPLIVTGLTLVAMGGCQQQRQERAMTQRDQASETTLETATFAAGCFWGIEQKFRAVQGVIEAEVGYTGGAVKNPTYKQVCGGTTGHAEAVRVRFDPRVVSYEQLLDVFWASHDPTTLNRQGPDVGTQYRSVIFVHGDAQKAAAVKSKQAHQSKFGGKIVTEIVTSETFWRAEEYHQQYLQKRGGGSCKPG